MILLQAVGDEVPDGADLEAVQLREGDEIVHPRHRPILLHDLADHARGIEAGQAGDVDRRLGMAGADQHPAILRYQWEDVAGGDDVLRALGCIDRDGDGAGAVARGDAGGHAVPRLDRGGEGRFVAGAVVPAHQLQAELVDPALGHGEADETSPVLGHEVDRVRSRHLRRDHQIAFILPVLVVDKDEHAAVPGLVDQFLGGGQEAASHQRRSSSIRPR
jgi:hypothetical protein